MAIFVVGNLAFFGIGKVGKISKYTIFTMGKITDRKISEADNQVFD